MSTKQITYRYDDDMYIRTANYFVDGITSPVTNPSLPSIYIIVAGSEETFPVLSQEQSNTVKDPWKELCVPATSR